MRRRRRWLIVSGCLIPLACGAICLAAVAIQRIRYRAIHTDAVSHTLSVDGRTRHYALYVPPTYDGDSAPVPLVLVLHGGGGSAQDAEKLSRSGFNRLADRDGFLVAYPEGIDHGWNDGRDLDRVQAQSDQIDDVGFIGALIDQLAADYRIDPARVYATGISNGGEMSYRLACELSDRIAAAAPVAANLSDNLAATCAPFRPVPLLIVAGTDDPLMRWEGGHLRFLRQDLGHVKSIPDSVAFWAAYDGCPAAPEIVTLPDTAPHDGTHVRRETYAPCADGAEVVLIAIEGGGHTWPGGYHYLPKLIVGRTSRDIDATALIWEFFQAHPLPKDIGT